MVDPWLSQVYGDRLPGDSTPRTPEADDDQDPIGGAVRRIRRRHVEPPTSVEQLGDVLEPRRRWRSLLSWRPRRSRGSSGRSTS